MAEQGCDLTISIVSFNTKEYLKRCLQAILSTTGSLRVHTIVIDNASRDGSAEMVASEFPRVEIIANQRNRGFAAANNQAIRRARGRHVLLLNPDTEVQPEALARLVRFLDEHPEAAAVGAQLRNPDGSIQPSVRRFPTFASLLHAHTLLGRLGILRRAHDRQRMRGFSFNEARRVEQPSGAALAIRRNVFEQVGLLDEAYFIFYEEVDFCRRLAAANLPVYFEPRAVVIHHRGKSRQQVEVEVYPIQLQSLLHYLRKFAGPNATAAFNVFFKPLLVAEVLVGLLDDWLALQRYVRLRPNPYKAWRKRERLRARWRFLGHHCLSFLRRA